MTDQISLQGFSKETILIVDDDAIVLDTVADALKNSYSSLVAESGKSALMMVQTYSPDLVLLSNQLKDQSCYEICRILKIEKKTMDIPAIFLSSLPEPSLAVKAFEVGAADYVVKPVNIPELQRRIHSLITARRAQKRLERKLIHHTEFLEKTNAALHASLQHREAESRALEENIFSCIKKYIYPYLDKLEKSKTRTDAANYIQIIRSNLNELIPSTSNAFSASYLRLTPAEIKVADMIRQGKQTKQIARQFNLSTKSVFYYRNTIRKKLGLVKKKVNLTTYLNSLSNR